MGFRENKFSFVERDFGIEFMIYSCLHNIYSYLFEHRHET